MKLIVLVALVAAALGVTFSQKKPAVQTPSYQTQFRPCVWPNTCKESSDVVQFTTCVYPKTCGKKPS